MRSGLLDALRYRADDGGGAGGQVHVDRAPPQPLGKPAVAGRDLLDLRRARQRRQHDVGRASDLGGRLRPAGAALAQLRRRGRLDVVHHECMAGLYELRGHTPAHSAQADESDAQRIVLSPLPCLPEGGEETRGLPTLAGCGVGRRPQSTDSAHNAARERGCCRSGRSAPDGKGKRALGYLDPAQFLSRSTAK